MTSAQIADGAVTGSKIATRAVERRHIGNEAVGSAQIEQGSIRRVDLDPELQPHHEYLTGAPQQVAEQAVTVVVKCPDRLRAVAGGWEVTSGPESVLRVLASHPGAVDEWTLRFASAGGAVEVVPGASCVRAGK